MAPDCTSEKLLDTNQIIETVPVTFAIHEALKTGQTLFLNSKH